MTEKPNSRARACVCGQAFQFLSLRVSIKNPLTVWKCSPLSLSLFVSLTGTRLFSLPAFLEGKKQKAKKEEEANEKKERKNKSRERREEADQWHRSWPYRVIRISPSYFLWEGTTKSPLFLFCHHFQRTVSLLLPFLCVSRGPVGRSLVVAMRLRHVSNVHNRTVACVRAGGSGAVGCTPSCFFFVFVSLGRNLKCGRGTGGKRGGGVGVRGIVM